MFLPVTGKLPFKKGRFLAKTLLIMKLIAIFIFAAVLQVSASGYAQNITLVQNNVSLKKVFKEIERQSGYSFFYKDKLLKQTENVDVNVKGASVKELLDQCLKNRPLSYTILDKIIVIKAKDIVTPAAFVEERAARVLENIIAGAVKDVLGNPLSGVSVIIKGSTKGTSTTADGKFTIDANVGDVLEFSIVGYSTKSVTVGSAHEIDVSLDVEAVMGNEVVVVGYGTQKKVNLTGSVAQIKGAEIENRPVSNATRSLEGLVPGLNISVAGNTHPGSSFNLNIRGAGNLSGSDQPYVLVDGVAMSLSDVNPDDIESISVLKDAAASAIYGARAPYGVILVTTKTGKKGRVEVRYSNNIGITSPLKLPDPVNSYDFAQYFNTATFNAIGTKQYSDAQLQLLKDYIKDPKGISIYPGATGNSYAGLENSSAGVGNTNWFDFNYKPHSYNQTHNLSLSGGNDKTQYYVSGGLYDESGLMRYAKIDFDRINFNASLTSQITPWLKFHINSKFLNSNYEAPFSGDFESLYFHDMVRMRPNISPYDLNGHFNEISFVPYLQSGSKDDLKNFNFAIIPGLEIEPIKNWKIFLDINYLRNEQQESVLRLPALVYGIDGTPVYMNRSEFNIPLLGGYTRRTSTNNYVSPNVYTSYNYSINNEHNFTAMVGFQQEVNEYQQINGSTQDLISSTTPGINLSTGNQSVIDTRNHWATRGFFGRFNYNYKEKYLVEINGRADGSSRFASNNRWGTFPSFSLGYNIARENFMQPFSDKINLLKIRASYGFLGNQSGAGLYSYTQLMNISTPGASGAGSDWFFQNGRESNLLAPQPYNPNVTWEKVENGNIGLDFGLLHHRLSGSIDIYQRTTDDMLGPTQDVADMYGGTPPLSNNASLRTRGFELSLNWNDRISSNVSYNLFANLSNNSSVVTKYQNLTNTNPANSWYVGKRVGEIWGYSASGLIQTQKEADEYNQTNLSFLTGVKWKAGDVKYIDLNNDGKINNGNNTLGNMGDTKIIGNATPKYAYSFGGTINYKSLSMYIMFQGIGKMNFWPGQGSAYFWGDGALAQVVVYQQHMDYWTPDNPKAYYPNPYAAPAGSINSFTSKTQQPSDRYLQNAAYLRLKNVTVSYGLPKTILNKIRLKQAKIFVAAENLFTITKLSKMFDPEMLIGGVDPGKAYPLTKVNSIGISVTL
jgi:TonB-linked SusC/RagA family outer membrane protein